MRIRRTGLFVMAAATLLVASAAHADEYFRKGFYLNGSVAYGFNQMDTGTFVQTFQIPSPPFDAFDSWGLNVRAGSQVYSWLAFELEYEWMKRLILELPPGSSAVVGQAQNVAGSASLYSLTYEPDIITVNAKFVLPFWRVQPYLLIGGGIAIYDVIASVPYDSFSRSGEGFAFRGGGGIDVYITKHIAVNVESSYLLNTSSFDIYTVPAIDNLDYISLSGGVTYHF